ncbi:MAG: NAD(P)H-dependent glycerol-3-phosphate dehydrogenase [Cyanobacteria bacterium J06641_5]
MSVEGFGVSQDAVTLAVLGAGAWGTTLAELARRQGHVVRVWSRRGSASLESAIAGVDLVVAAISMAGVRPVCQALQVAGLPAGAAIASATKGLDAQSLQTPGQLWQAYFPATSIVVLSGPNLSKEIEQGLPAAAVAASTDLAAASLVQRVFSSQQFRTYVNADPLGVELGGALKNVVAIAAGVCDGLQLGTNAKAALLTRALPEIVRVGETLGAQTPTFYGLSGLGDLLATCGSPLSRNYQVGYRLAQGQTLEQAIAAITGTAEGVNTARVLVQLAAQRGITVPIATQVARLLAGAISPSQAVQSLMERELKAEFS